MNEVEKVSQIKRENLDEKNYLKSLIEEGYKKGILDENDILNINIEIYLLLDERVYRYNGIESSSIRKEVLEEIQISNLYTIGIYLKTFQNPDDALKVLKEVGIKEAFEKGRERMNRLLKVIKTMHIRVKNNKLNVKNDTYDETILYGITGFLKIYNPDYEAHNMKITADYPLYNNLIGQLEGVEFILEYLKSIYLENEFCNMFTEEKIKQLLYSFSNNYKELIINIFEIVFLEVIACKLVGRNTTDLIISKSELEQIYLIFERLVFFKYENCSISGKFRPVYKRTFRYYNKSL